MWSRKGALTLILSFDEFLSICQPRRLFSSFVLRVAEMVNLAAEVYFHFLF